MKYRKKSIVIEAEVYKKGMEDGWIPEDELITDLITKEMFAVSKVHDGCREYPFIKTLEGMHYISDGDYIIEGIVGERYCCKPDIFIRSYDKEEEEVDDKPEKIEMPSITTVELDGFVKGTKLSKEMKDWMQSVTNWINNHEREER